MKKPKTLRARWEGDGGYLSDPVVLQLLADNIRDEIDKKIIEDLRKQVDPLLPLKKLIRRAKKIHK